MDILKGVVNATRLEHIVSQNFTFIVHSFPLPLNYTVINGRTIKVRILIFPELMQGNLLQTI
jgi:hypothetical protein